MAHAKDHALNSTSDHTAGTASTLLGTSAAPAVTEVSYGTAAAGSTIVQRDLSGDVLVADNVGSGAAAVNKNYVDSLVTGHRAPVSVRNLKSDAAQAGAPPAGQAQGDAWVVNNWGGGYTNGDLVELTSTGPDVWTVIVAQVGGVVPTGTRAIVKTAGAAGSFAGQGTKIAQKTAIGWSFTAPNDGDQAAVVGEGSIYENQMYIFDTVPGNWVVMGSAVPHNSLSGLDGGTPGQYYHFTSAQHTELAKMKAPVVDAANNVPTEAVLTGLGWVAGDYGFYRTTTNSKSWWVWYRAALNVDSVQM
jgi:hypothetical protein